MGVRLMADSGVMFTRRFDRRVRIAAAVLSGSVALGFGFGAFALWPSNLETGYEPAQPIAFSHKVHAGDMQIDCLYCHTGASKGAQATVPRLSVCMNCHSEVRPVDERGEIKPDIAVLIDRWENKEPVRWNKVNDLADFVFFDHSRHLHAGVDCRECHGPVETMERIERVYGLKMRWCLECHRRSPPPEQPGTRPGQPERASVECVTCHR
jgi:hypothetical protein